MGLRSNEIAGVLVRNGAKPENSDAAWAWLQRTQRKTKSQLGISVGCPGCIMPMQCGAEEAVRELLSLFSRTWLAVNAR